MFESLSPQEIAALDHPGACPGEDKHGGSGARLAAEVQRLEVTIELLQRQVHLLARRG